MKLVRENINFEKPESEEEFKDQLFLPDYSQLDFQMGRYMPADAEIEDEYWDIIENKEITLQGKRYELKKFLEKNAYFEIMAAYMPEGGSLDGFIRYLVKNKR